MNEEKKEPDHKRQRTKQRKSKHSTREQRETQEQGTSSIFNIFDGSI